MPETHIRRTTFESQGPAERGAEEDGWRRTADRRIEVLVNVKHLGGSSSLCCHGTQLFRIVGQQGIANTCIGAIYSCGIVLHIGYAMPIQEPMLSVKAQRARQAITDGIASGRFQPGQRLPSERQLAAELGINHLTLRRALSQLASEGLIDRQPGVGTFVRSAGRARYATGIAIVLARQLFRVASHAAAAPILAGVHDTFDAHTFSVQNLTFDHASDWPELASLIVDKGIRGVLLHPTIRATRQDVQTFARQGVKIVLLSPHDLQVPEGVPWARADSIQPAVQIIDRLAALGHRRVHVVDFEISIKARRDAIADSMAVLGLGELQQNLTIIPNKGGEEDLRPLGALVARLKAPDAPTALVLADEMLAHQMFSLFDGAGIRVPEHVSVAVLENNAPWFNRIPLTGPDSGLARTKTASMASQALRDLVTGVEPRAIGTVIASPVVWTSSIASPRQCVSK